VANSSYQLFQTSSMWTTSLQDHVVYINVMSVGFPSSQKCGWCAIWGSFNYTRAHLLAVHVWGEEPGWGNSILVCCCKVTAPIYSRWHRTCIRWLRLACSLFIGHLYQSLVTCSMEKLMLQLIREWR